MIIAAYKLQLFPFFVNVCPDFLGGVEIHGRAFYRKQFSGGDGSGKNFSKVFGVQCYQMIGNITCIMAVQVKIGMVGHVENCVFITGSVIFQLQFVFFIYGICNLQLLVSGEAHVSVRHIQSKNNAVFHFAGIPYSLVAAQLFMAVQVVHAVIGV